MTIQAEEAKSKGSFSRRTLKLLSTISKEEANLITYFGKFVWQANKLTPILFTDENGDTEGITFDKLSVLDSLGVIQQGIGYSLQIINTLKCIFSMGLRNDCLIKFLKYFCIA